MISCVSLGNLTARECQVVVAALSSAVQVHAVGDCRSMGYQGKVIHDVVIFVHRYSYLIILCVVY